MSASDRTHLDLLAVVVSLADGSIVDDILLPGHTWWMGRGAACNLKLAGNPAVSRRAVGVRYDVHATRTGDKPRLRVLPLQGGSGRIVIESATGDHLELAAHAPAVALRPGARHDIHLLAPGREASISITTPPWNEANRGRPEPTALDTQSWTASSRSQHPWVDIAALAASIERHPRCLPRTRDGKQVSASHALRLASEVFLGRSSNDYIQARLTEAARASGVVIRPGQDRQSRVAGHYGRLFEASKLRRLVESIADDMQALLWALEGEDS